jgi:asparagine synthase (glutamine-hydrolysing)
MCGIAGFVRQRGGWDDEKTARVVSDMCRRIAHRGPDDQRVAVTGNAALGARRLAIIDLSGGYQPIAGEDGSVTVAYNGEIYNYRDLRKGLQSLGHQFKTQSDTEVIVHAYEEYGASCVDHLRGMFAFAVWDAARHTLFLARDRVGEKPLYYTLTPTGTLVFGSELKSLLVHPEVTRDVDLQALDGYLSFGYVPDPRTIFSAFSKLPAGCSLTFKDGRISVAQYWDFTYEPSAPREESDYVEELRSLLDEAVRIRLVADVPLGAFLSGGLDSTTVVGLMAKHLDRPVKTFTIGFREERYSELSFARAAARHFATDHHELVVTPDAQQLVQKLAWHFDEPFADDSAIPTYLVSQLARSHVTVALSGDGGDELFGGYTRYVTEQQRSAFGIIPQFLRRGLLAPLSRRLPHRTWGRNYLHNVALDPFNRYLDNISIFSELNKQSLYTREFRLELRGSDVVTQVRQYIGRTTTGANLDELLYFDSKTYLPGDILTKVDRMSMAVSLEARAPLLDHKLIEFVTRIPAGLKLRGKNSKGILKRAVSDLIPAEIRNRQKQGFAVPIKEWINNELRDCIRDTLCAAKARDRGLIEPAYVETLLDEHTRGRRDHSAGLWTLFMLEMWYRTFVDSTSTDTAQSARCQPLPFATAGGT